jgi:dienelactone hydrolase
LRRGKGSPFDERAPPLHLLLKEATALLGGFYRAFGKPGEVGPADATPVMVIPGFLATDRSTLGLQRALAEAGYRVTGWGLGVNRGATSDMLDRMTHAVADFGRGRPVVLVGWSLGGVYARELAKARPDLVAKVVTMGTPFSGNPRANNVWRLYELVAGHRVDSPPVGVNVETKPPVPTIALWSRRDGVIAPACARGLPEQSDRQVEVNCSHMGFAVSKQAWPAVIEAVRG